MGIRVCGDVKDYLNGEPFSAIIRWMNECAKEAGVSLNDLEFDISVYDRHCEIEVWRKETDAEIAARHIAQMRAREAIQAEMQRKEREEYERLKAKFS